jgi:hypothetical protein
MLNKKTKETRYETVYQLLIPGDLSVNRYISGKAALNLPAPEGTSGDWHFFGYFYRSKPGVIVYLAGDGEAVNTNHIYGGFGVHDCTISLKMRDLVQEGNGTPYAANHFRAILDMLYDLLTRDVYPRRIQSATEDFLDTVAEKEYLLEKAVLMFPFLSKPRQDLLGEWLEKEKLPL